MNTFFATTFNQRLYKEYAHNFIRTYIDTKQEIPVICYVDDDFEYPVHKNITYLKLHEAMPQILTFKEKHKDKILDLEFEAASDIHFLQNAVRFSHKVFAQVHASYSKKKFLYIDADNVFRKKITEEFVEEFIPDDVVITCYGRPNWVETGIIGYNSKLGNISKKFFDLYLSYYMEDKIFKMRFKTDSQALDGTRKLMRKVPGYKEVDKGDGVDGHVIHRDKKMLIYLDHRKGVRKFEPHERPIIIAIDTANNDNLILKIINGIKIHQKKNPNVIYRIFGNKDVISEIITKTGIDVDKYELVDTKEKNTSMLLAIENAKNKESDIVISLGKTEKLFDLANQNLNLIRKINKPVLSILLPNKIGMNIILDLNTNSEYSDFSLMGAALFKILFKNKKAKVALLNIGSEEFKGNEVIKNTYQKLNNIKSPLYEFYGYIEGNEVMNGDANIIVTDGFTGNIMIKAREGVTNFITSEFKKTMTSNLIGKFSFFFKFKKL
jgi:glycerol-3-phosphate acyltransferase PlsX